VRRTAIVLLGWLGIPPVLWLMVLSHVDELAGPGLLDRPPATVIGAGLLAAVVLVVLSALTARWHVRPSGGGVPAWALELLLFVTAVALLAAVLFEAWVFAWAGPMRPDDDGAGSWVATVAHHALVLVGAPLGLLVGATVQATVLRWGSRAQPARAPGRSAATLAGLLTVTVVVVCALLATGHATFEPVPMP
jgi:hypothetical protein